jgi:hypothetical protein
MKGSPHYRFSKEELDWVAQNLDDTQAWARGSAVIWWTLVGTFLLGLAVHVLGFAFATGALDLPAGWPTDLVADLLANLGIALWTSVVLVLFLEIMPDWQRRRAETWARAALAALRDRGDVPASAAEVEPNDPVEAKLDLVLERLTALEARVGGGQKPAT